MYAQPNATPKGQTISGNHEAQAVYAPAPKAPYLVIDIETSNAPADAINDALNAWKPPSNVKDPAKIDGRRVEAFDRITERAALLDASPITCATVKCGRLAMIFDGMGASAGVDGWNTIHTQDEEEMLLHLRTWLDWHCSPETKMVGHNCRAFDFPKLRNAYLRHSLKLPEILKPRGRDEENAEIVDTAQLFKHFSMEHRDEFCSSLDTVCASLGIERPKALISGADVPKLHAEGRFAEILTYCAIDTVATERAFLLMTGQSGGLR